MAKEEILTKQNILTVQSNRIIQDWYDKYPNIGFSKHQHKCTFELLNKSNDKKRLCKKWRKKHPEVDTLGKDYRCDCCEMMNYLVIDDNGCIAATCHPTELMIKDFITKVYELREEKKNGH